MRTKFYYLTMIAAVCFAGFSSCKKDVQGLSSLKTTNTTTTTTTLAATATQSIAIASLASTAATHDSLYVVGCFPPKGTKDSIAFSALPATVGTYLTANYAGYTFVKAFSVTDSTKTINGFVVIIKFNSKPVGLKFNATGTFVKVLEQRAGADLGSHDGFHPGGPFGDRGEPGKDTIAITALPTAVSSYFSTTYPTDTLLHASITPDTSYVLISKNSGLYATVVSAAGKLIDRRQIDNHPGPQKAVTQTALLSSITTYLTTTYPGYVFDKAFAALKGTTVQGYVVFITSNSTKYALKFDATGAFVSAKALR